MNQKAFVLIISIVLSLSIFVTCKEILDSGSSSQEESENNEDDGSSSSDATSENCEIHEDSDDYVLVDSEIIPIILNGNTITGNSGGVTVDGGKATITAAGNYGISGSLTDGQIVVNTEDKGTIRLILNGVNITCSNSAPIYVKSAKKVIVFLADNTNNYLTDGVSYVLDNAEQNEPCAPLFSMSDLTIFGNGSLIVDGNYYDGIVSQDGLIIKSGTILVSAIDDGIRGKDYMVVKGGNITVNATANGFKSDNTDDVTKGFISIEDGDINIASGGDAITAETDVIITDGEFDLTSGGGSDRTVSGTASAKAIKGIVSVVIDDGNFTVSSADDAIHSNTSVAISGGTFVLSSGDDGIHADSNVDINGGNVTISKSVEGIESAMITINNGNVNVTATDDGFNATQGTAVEYNDNSSITINGGYVCVNASRGDGLDSNGNIVVTAGKVIVHGPTSDPEVGMDFNGTCKISGGTFVMSGTNSFMTEAPSATSTQYSVLIRFYYSQAAKSICHIQDANGNDVMTFAPVRAYKSMILSSPNLTKGSTYTIFTGGSSTGTPTDGLYSGGAYSGGTSYASFTISSIITTVGSSSTGPGWF